MDWFTVALIVVFFVLPLIQQVLNQGRQQTQERETDQEEDELGALQSRRPRQVARPTAEREGGGWAEDWTPWPTQGDAGAPSPEPVELTRAEPVEPRPAPWSTYAPEEPSERAEVTVLPEPPRYQPPRELTRVESEEYQPSPIAAKPVRLRSLPAARPARVHSSIQLRGGKRELKRAIVLKEVLGPPAALRSREEESLW